MQKIIPIIMVFNFLLSLCFFGVKVSASSYSDSDITVKLSAYLGNQKTVKVSITGKYVVEADKRVLNGTYEVKAESGQLVLYKNGTKLKVYGASFTVRPEVYNIENIIAVNDRKYLGTMRFEVENGSFVRPYNTLPVDDCLLQNKSTEVCKKFVQNLAA